MLLQSAAGLNSAVFVFTVVIVVSLLGMIALTRAGILIFWNVDTPDDPEEIERMQLLKQKYRQPKYLGAACISLFSVLIAMVIFASPLKQYANATAFQLKNGLAYQTAILQHDMNHDVVSTRLFDPGYLPYVNKTYNKALSDDMADETQIVEDQAQIDEDQQIDHSAPKLELPKKLPSKVEAKLEPMESNHE